MSNPKHRTPEEVQQLVYDSLLVGLIPSDFFTFGNSANPNTSVYGWTDMLVDRVLNKPGKPDLQELSNAWHQEVQNDSSAYSSAHKEGRFKTEDVLVYVERARDDIKNQCVVGIAIAALTHGCRIPESNIRFGEGGFEVICIAPKGQKDNELLERKVINEIGMRLSMSPLRLFPMSFSMTE